MLTLSSIPSMFSMCKATQQHNLTKAVNRHPFLSIEYMLPQVILSRDHTVLPNPPQVKLKEEESKKMI